MASLRHPPPDVLSFWRNVLKWQVVTLHACENFRLAIDEKLFQLGYQTIALPRVEDLIAAGRRDDHCILLFDMFDDEAWVFVKSAFQHWLPNAVTLPVNAMNFTERDATKIDTYCDMIALSKKLFVVHSSVVGEAAYA
jgi:hypothetical protein